MEEVSWIAEVGVGWAGAIAAGTLLLEMPLVGTRSEPPLQVVQIWGMAGWMFLVWEPG